MENLVRLDLIRLEAETSKRRKSVRDKIKTNLEGKSFIDFKNVRLDLPEKPTSGYSLSQWHEIEKMIVNLFVERGIWSIDTCRLDNYLGILTITHPELFEEEFHGYVSSRF